MRREHKGMCTSFSARSIINYILNFQETFFKKIKKAKF